MHFSSVQSKECLDSCLRRNEGEGGVGGGFNYYLITNTCFGAPATKQSGGGIINHQL